jgi:hypothetical protein
VLFFAGAREALGFLYVAIVVLLSPSWRRRICDFAIIWLNELWMIYGYDDMTEYDELRLLHTNCSNDCEVQGDESSVWWGLKVGKWVEIVALGKNRLLPRIMSDSRS